MYPISFQGLVGGCQPQCLVEAEKGDGKTRSHERGKREKQQWRRDEMHTKCVHSPSGSGNKKRKRKAEEENGKSNIGEYLQEKQKNWTERRSGKLEK